MGLLDWFQGKAGNNGTKSGLIGTFHSDTEKNRTRCEKIKTITIPADIQAFTTGMMIFQEDGSFPEITARFDARRNESGGWDIRRFRLTEKSLTLGNVTVKAGEDDTFIGHAKCDFDALRFLSEESAARGFRSRDKGKGHRDLPHWKTLAAQAKQPIDAAGLVQPVVKGQVLADNVTFDDPIQTAIRDSTLPPAIAAPAPQEEAPKPMPVKNKAPDLLTRLFDALTPRPDPGELFKAVRDNDIEQVQQLLARGAAVNAKDKDDWTPLHRAAFWRIKGAVSLLLEKNADVNAKDRWGRTPLHWAAFDGSKDTVSLLLEKGADANAKDEDNQTPRHLAEKKGCREVAAILRQEMEKSPTFKFISTITARL